MPSCHAAAIGSSCAAKCDRLQVAAKGRKACQVDPAAAVPSPDQFLVKLAVLQAVAHQLISHERAP